MNEKIKNSVKESLLVKEKLFNDNTYIQKVKDSIDLIVKCYNAGGKVFICGNGGSAADAQHLAAELSGRYYFDRPPLNAEALNCNTSYITAVANDYSFDVIYERIIKASGKKNDVLIALSTSGNSENIVLALKSAKEKEMHTIGLTGKNDGKISRFCDILINMPSDDTARIQEAHIMTGHIICEWIEKKIFKND